MGQLSGRFVAARKILKKAARQPHTRTSIENRLSNVSVETLIPGQVYQTVREKNLDSEHAMGVELLRDKNPNLDFLVLDDREVQDYMEEAWGEHRIYQVFQAARLGVIRADIFRYCVLADRGGYYLDINKSPSCDLQILHRSGDSALLTYDRDDSLVFPPISVASEMEYPHKLIAQWGMAFSPGHLIPQLAIERMVEIYPFFARKPFFSVRDAVFSFSGPGMFTSVVHSYLEGKGFDGVSFAGRLFFGQVVSRMPGAHRTPRTKDHYTAARNQILLD